MKKILFLFVMIASVAICSCKSGGNDDQNNAAGNELYNVDSISVDQFEDLLDDYISSEDVAGIQRLVAAANSTLNRITNKAEKTVFADKIKSVIRANETRLSKWFDVNVLLENILRVVPDMNTQPLEQSVQSDSIVYHSGSGTGTYENDADNATTDDPSLANPEQGNATSEPTIPGEEPTSSNSNSGTGTSPSSTSSPTTPAN